MTTPNGVAVALLLCSLAALAPLLRAEAKLSSSIKNVADDDYGSFDDFDYDEDDDDFLSADAWMPLLGLATIAPEDACEEDGAVTTGATTKSTTSAVATTTKSSTVLRPSRSGLCTVFHSLRDVIPLRQLVRLTAKHYKHDAKFRHAMSYLHTAQFANAAAQIEDSAVYQHMLLQFQDVGVNTTDLLSIGNIIDCVLIPTSMLVAAAKQAPAVSQAAPSTRSLQTFADDVFRAIPRRKLRTVMRSQLASNSDFAGFYRVLRTARFKRDALHGLANTQIADPLLLLRRNFIDLRQLLKFVFRVFSLGPRRF